jgi:hypothetical protein
MKKKARRKPPKIAPPFIQIAIGSAAKPTHGHEVFGLDANGRVWRYTDDEIVGGWELIDNDIWSPRRSR